MYSSMPRLCLLPHRPVTCSLSSFSRLAGRTDSVGWFSLLFTCTFFQFPLSPPTSAFGCSPANFNTHHGALGIIQQMPLRRTFLSGTIPLFTLFILKYLRPALIPEQNVSRPFFSHCKTTESEWIIKLCTHCCRNAQSVCGTVLTFVHLKGYFW